MVFLHGSSSDDKDDDDAPKQISTTKVTVSVHSFIAILLGIIMLCGVVSVAVYVSMQHLFDDDEERQQELQNLIQNQEANQQAINKANNEQWKQLRILIARENMLKVLWVKFALYVTMVLGVFAALFGKRIIARGSFPEFLSLHQKGENLKIVESNHNSFAVMVVSFVVVSLGLNIALITENFKNSYLVAVQGIPLLVPIVVGFLQGHLSSAISMLFGNLFHKSSPEQTPVEAATEATKHSGKGTGFRLYSVLALSWLFATELLFIVGVIVTEYYIANEKFEKAVAFSNVVAVIFQYFIPVVALIVIFLTVYTILRDEVIYLLLVFAEENLMLVESYESRYFLKDKHRVKFMIPEGEDESALKNRYLLAVRFINNIVKQYVQGKLDEIEEDRSELRFWQLPSLFGNKSKSFTFSTFKSMLDDESTTHETLISTFTNGIPIFKTMVLEKLQQKGVYLMNKNDKQGVLDYLSKSLMRFQAYNPMSLEYLHK